MTKLDLTKHIYTSDTFLNLIREAVEFFHKTPVKKLPLVEKFSGTGVYALYYSGDYFLYRKYAELNSVACHMPIYVGKAVPKGWRQAKVNTDHADTASELYTRVREHTRSIMAVSNLQLQHFSCRFLVFSGASAAMISTVEAALIQYNRPLWNVALDGFGNHDPGSGRYEQARSDWDVLHHGRAWADKCKGAANTVDIVNAKVIDHLKKI